MMNTNILQKFSKKLYFQKPFPHFEIENCLPNKIYDALEKEYKLFEEYFSKYDDFNNNNVRLQICSDEFFKIDLFKKSLWYDFISYHTSLDFLKNIIEVFYEDLNKTYPNVDFNLEELKNCGLRNVSNNKTKNFVLDCQPGINTKVKKKRTVRGAHIDNPHELIGGLFYLKHFNDNSGGDLELYEANNKIVFHQKAEVYNLEDIKLFKTVKYKPNNVVFFLNSPVSIHSVTERNKSDYLRRLTNIIVERYIDGYNFKMPRKENILKKILGRFYK